MKNKKPLVSVVASFYNEENNPLFIESVRSILVQDYKNIEYIFINDGSDDNTQKILIELLNTFKNKRIININRENKGLAKSLNEGIVKSKGKYIARFDAGDICNKNRISTQVNFLDNNPDISIVGTYANVVNEKNEIKRDWVVPIHPEDVKKTIFKTQIAIHSTILIKKDTFDKIGLYNPKFVTEDYEFYMRAIVNELKIANIPYFYVKVLDRKNGITNSKSYKMQVSRFCTRLKYLPKFINFKNSFYTFKSLGGCIIPINLIINKIKCHKI